MAYKYTTNKLPKSELEEETFVTIGRLAISIKDQNTQRSLTLLDKLIGDIVELEKDKQIKNSINEFNKTFQEEYEEVRMK